MNTDRISGITVQFRAIYRTSGAARHGNSIFVMKR